MKKGAQLTLFTPMTRIPQPNGDVILRPGKPVVLEEFIGTSETASLLGMSQRWVVRQCEEGQFRTAFRPAGDRPGNRWRLARSEVMARLGV